MRRRGKVRGRAVMIGTNREWLKWSQTARRAQSDSTTVRHRGGLAAGLDCLLALMMAARAHIQTFSVVVILWVGPVGGASTRVDALVVALAAAVDVVVPHTGATRPGRTRLGSSTSVGAGSLRRLDPREACRVGAVSLRLGLAVGPLEGRLAMRSLRSSDSLRAVGRATTKALETLVDAAVGEAGEGKVARILLPLHGRKGLVELGVGTEDEAAVGAVMAVLELDGAGTVGTEVEVDDAATGRGLGIEGTQSSSRGLIVHGSDRPLQRRMETDVTWELGGRGSRMLRDRAADGH